MAVERVDYPSEEDYENALQMEASEEAGWQAQAEAKHEAECIAEAEEAESNQLNKPLGGE